MPWQQKNTIIVILISSFLGFGCVATKTDTTQAAPDSSEAEALRSTRHIYYKSEEALQKLKAEREQKAKIDKERTQIREAIQSKKTAALRNLCSAAQFEKDAPVTCIDILSNDIRGPYLTLLSGINNNPFFISRYEIRVGDYGSYCRASGNCTTVQKNQLLPITGISILEARNYAAWLSANTGYTYRLPTLTEWTYAAKADGGKQPTVKNCRVYVGSILQYGIKIENINFQKRQTSNAWGVANYLGNVQELVIEDDAYFAVGGHFDDLFEDCEISKKRPLETKLDEKTGFRLVRER